MIIKQFGIGDMKNFCYIIADEKTKHAAVIDPGFEPERILKEAEGFEIKSILLTHNHFDHIRQLRQVLIRTNATAYIHPAENYDRCPTQKLKDGQTINLGELEIKVIHTPGHTPGSVCYLVENNLFTGDTVFVQGIGRTDFREGNPEDMETSLQKIAQLPDDTIVWPGHNYNETAKTSTIGEEKRLNPYFLRQ